MGIKIAVTRFATNTSTGTQDITTTDLGGLTPKAVLFVATRGVTNGTAVDGAGFYLGLSDGTFSASQAYEDQHAAATMNNAWWDGTAMFRIGDGTASETDDGLADFDSWLTNGVRINWTNAPSSGFLVTAIFFAGSDLTAKTGFTSLGNTANALVTITDIGFEADTVLTWTAQNTSTLNPNAGFGVIHNNRSGTVTQRAVAHKQRDGFSASRVGAVMRNDACVVQFQQTDNLDWYGTAQSFDADGFDIQLGNARSPGNAGICWLALRFGSSPVVSSKVYTYTTPTATGSNTDSNPGFQPQLVLYLATRTATANTEEYDNDGGTIGLLVTDGTNVFTNSIGSEDTVGDTNSQSLSDNKLNLPTDAGASGHQATLSSMGSTGPVWSYSATDATARVWGALAIQVGASGTQFTQSASGNMTPSGAILKQGNKLLLGANLPSGDINKSASKFFSGDTTPSGGLLKQAQKVLSGAISSIVGTLESARTFIKDLAGSISPFGDINRLTNKDFTGQLTSDGQTNKSSTRTLSGTISSSGDILKSFILLLAGTLDFSGDNLKQTDKVLSGTLDSSGIVSKLYAKLLEGTLTLSGLVSKSANKLLSGILDFAGDFVADFVPGGQVYFKSVDGSITPAGTINSLTYKSFVGVLDTAGSLIAAGLFARALSGLLSIQGSVSKSTTKSFLGSLTSSGIVSVTSVFIKILEGTLTSSGIISKTSNKVLQGQENPSGSLVKFTDKFVSGTLPSVGSIGRGFFKELFGTLLSSGIVTTVTNVIQSTAGKVYLLGNRILTETVFGIVSTAHTLKGKAHRALRFLGRK